jgi:hypothetical protein
MPFDVIATAAELLDEHDLLDDVDAAS